jgi:16S rRNA (uracil1498-N3)-methyltransferase
MVRVFCQILPTAGQTIALPEDESHHLVKVLRAESGQKVLAIDGAGQEILGELEIRAKRGWLRFQAPHRTEAVPNFRLFLETAVLKNDSFSWVIEKAVELGCTDFVPLLTERTVVRLKSKEPEEFQSRWQRTADQSLKQCGRLWRMNVHPPQTLGECLAQRKPGSQATRLICDEALSGASASSSLLKAASNALQAHHRSLHVLVGPEGGWSESERALFRIEDKALVSVSLGPYVLRGETACISALAQIRGSLHEQGLLDNSSPAGGFKS